MGKAKIVEHLGQSEYRVIYYYDMTEINNKKIRIDADIVSALAEIAIKETELIEEKSNLEVIEAALDLLIINYKNCSDLNPEIVEEKCASEKEAIKIKNVEYLLKRSEIGDLETTRDDLLFIHEKLKKEKIHYAGIVGEETIDIWCVDLCDRETGEPDFGLWLNHGDVIPVDSFVGTIEIFDFIYRRYNKYIVPASYTANPAYDQLIHGLAGNVLANDGNAFVYNYNMRGPQMAWHPEYRLAIINSITEAGIAEITYNNIKDLDGVKFNTEDHLHDSAITVDYMICPTNTPFKAGDQVIVTFEGDKMLNPKIIGYHKHPKACQGVLDFHYNPIYGQYGGGWGAPFYDGVPLPIDEPYGTLFTNNDEKTHDDRNKISEIRSSGFTPLFGEQMISFPGNNYFNGENGTVGWWATGSVMNLNNSGWANSTCFNSVVGDIVRIWDSDSKTGRPLTYQYWVLTHNKDGTGYDPDKYDGGPTNFDAYFGHEHLFMRDYVFINGVKKTLTAGVDYGVNGVFIAGCSLGFNVITGFWLFYITSPVALNGNISDETVNALKLNTDTYYNLGNIGVIYDPNDSADYNKGKYFFSDDGTKFIGRRKNSNGSNVTLPDDWFNDTMDLVRGTISFDAVTGLPILAVATESLGNLGNFSKKSGGEFVVGFQGNNESILNVYPDGTGEGTPELQIIFYDTQHDIVVARMTALDGPNPYHEKIYVQIGGKLWGYPYDIVSGTYDFSAGANVGLTIESIVCDEVSDAYSNGSFIATEWGLMMSIGGYDLNEWMVTADFEKNSNNVFIATDGTVTQLSEELLKEPNGDPSVSPDPLLRMRPLGLSRKSTN